MPGIIKAYKESTIDAFTSAEVYTITLKKEVSISYAIEDMGKVYDILKSRGYDNIKSLFDPTPSILISVPLNQLTTIRAQILADYYGYQLDDIKEDFVSERIEVSF